MQASPSPNQRQFGLKRLFWWIFVVAVLAAIVVALRATRFGNALHSWHALLALTPIVVLATVSIAYAGEHRKLAFFAPLLYVAALGTPAIVLASDFVFGWSAFLLSFLGLTLFANLGSGGERLWYPIACAFGASANVAFILGYFALLGSWRRNSRGWYPKRIAQVGMSLGILATIALVLSTELNAATLGHGMWIASFQALALSTQSSETATFVNQRAQ